jgi:hypothetical protein
MDENKMQNYNKISSRSDYGIDRSSAPLIRDTYSPDRFASQLSKGKANPKAVASATPTFPMGQGGGKCDDWLEELRRITKTLEQLDQQKSNAYALSQSPSSVGRIAGGYERAATDWQKRSGDLSQQVNADDDCDDGKKGEATSLFARHDFLADRILKHSRAVKAASEALRGTMFENVPYGQMASVITKMAFEGTLVKNNFALNALKNSMTMFAALGGAIGGLAWEILKLLPTLFKPRFAQDHGEGDFPLTPVKKQNLSFS